MDPRKPSSNTKFEILKSKLVRLGYYEEGMQIREMRHILHAIQISTDESESMFSVSETQRALRESRAMTTSSVPPPRDDDVPGPSMMRKKLNRQLPVIINVQPRNMVVDAQIHRSLSWSPPFDSTSQKRSAATSFETDTPIDADINSKKLEQEEPSTCQPLSQTLKKLDEKPSTSQSLPKTSEEESTRHSQQLPQVQMVQNVDSTDNPNTSSNPSTASLSTQQSSHNVHGYLGPLSVQIPPDYFLYIPNTDAQTSSIPDTAEQPTSSSGNSDKKSKNRSKSKKDQQN